MKIPKKLRIYGADWKVIKNDNLKSLGTMDWGERTISYKPSDRPSGHADDVNTILHEILEAVMTQNDCRYADNLGNSHFFLDHPVFQRVIDDFTAILLDNRLI